MDVNDAMRASFGRAKMITEMLLGDLSDADLLVRPTPGANHVAWQLGHMVLSLNYFGDAVKPGSMPALPERFAEQHSKETAGSNDPAAFLSKQAYLDLLNEQREALAGLLATLPSTRLDEVSPEELKGYAPRISDILSLAAEHEMMHAGQFTVVRRKLGKPVMF